MTAEIDSSGLSLAFGCFHFRPILKEGDAFDARRYVQAVTQALEESAGIDNVIADFDDDHSFEMVVPGAAPTIREIGGPFPLLDFFGLEFDVRIPARLQDELVGPGVLGRVGTESFRVRLRNGYEMPVSTVELLDADGSANPSRAVVLVREFLRREFERSKQQKIEFECLGPSPAHSDYFLVPAQRPEEQDARFWRISYERPAYREYHYGFDPAAFSSPQQVVDEFHFEAVEEFSVFYRLAQESVIRGSAWGHRPRAARADRTPGPPRSERLDCQDTPLLAAPRRG